MPITQEEMDATQKLSMAMTEKQIYTQLVQEGYSAAQISIYVDRMKKGEKPWLDTKPTAGTLSYQEQHSALSQGMQEHALVTDLQSQGYTVDETTTYIARLKNGEQPWLDMIPSNPPSNTVPVAVSASALNDLQQERQMLTQLQMEGYTKDEAIIYYGRMQKGERPWMDPPGLQVDGVTPVK